jgi:signal peptidase I
MRLLAIGAATAAIGCASTEWFRVASANMMPTLRVGARVSVDENAAPRRLDIVLIRLPRGAETSNRCGRPFRAGAMCERAAPGLSDTTAVFRLVGMPGDRLSMREGRLIRNGRTLDERFIRVCRNNPDGCTFPRAITVPAGHFFLLGDNRGASDDSRFWGAVPRRAIIGPVTRCDPEPRTGCP